MEVCLTCAISTDGGSAGPTYLPSFTASSQEKKGSSPGQESFSSENVAPLFNLKHLLGAKYMEGGEVDREIKIQHFKVFF